MTQLETQNLPKESSNRKLSEYGWVLKFFSLPISVLDIEQELEWNQWGLSCLVGGGGNKETCPLPSGNMPSVWLLPLLGIHHLPLGSGLWQDDCHSTSFATSFIPPALPPARYIWRDGEWFQRVISHCSLCQCGWDRNGLVGKGEKTRRKSALQVN